jgi:uncharacterized protein YnzC (UPF0291/DUF896 family)
LITPDKINRINELVRKAKSLGLTEQEQQEQSTLRQEYIQAVRQSFQVNLQSLKIVDEQGNVLKEHGDHKLKPHKH